MSLAPDDPRHGTHNGYANLGCRCDSCRTANTEYRRHLAHKHGRQPLAEYIAATTKHGAKRYQKGCRCDVCRAASAAQKRRQRARHPELRARENAARRTRHHAARSRAA